MQSSSTAERLAQARREGVPDGEVTMLCLDGTRQTDLALVAPFRSLEFLMLSNCNLLSLDALPELPQLKKLVMSDNKVSCLTPLVDKVPNLEHLDVSNNRLTDVGQVAVLGPLVKLRVLELFQNPLSKDAGYRVAIFAATKVSVIDGFNRDGEEVESEEDEDDEEDEDEEEDDADEGEEEDDAGEGEEEGAAGGEPEPKRPRLDDEGDKDASNPPPA